MAKKFKRRRGPSRYRSSRVEPILYAALSVAGVAAVVLLVMFVIVPFVKELFAPLPTVRYTPSVFVDSVEVDKEPEAIEEDLSELQREPVITYSTINDPYIYGDSIVFSTATRVDGIWVYNDVILYDIKEEEEKRIRVDTKYENTINFVMNDDYIVWCDAASDNGGRICAYVRSTGEQFAIKDYVYAAPTITMSGDIICFMQQAGDTTDRLYLYDLSAREAVTYKVFSDLEATPTPADLYGDSLVYAIPSETKGYDIVMLDIRTGKEKLIETGRVVYRPKSNGEDIAFLSSASGSPTDLYMIDRDKAILIDSDVMNYDMCDAGIVYTKDECIYLYDKEQKKSIRVNSNVTRAFLVEAHEEYILWYDVTGGYGDSADIVKYAKVS